MTTPATLNRKWSVPIIWAQTIFMYSNKGLAHLMSCQRELGREGHVFPFSIVANLQIGVKPPIVGFQVSPFLTKTCTANRPAKIRFFAGLGFRSAVALRRPTSSDHAVPAWLLLSAVYKREPLRHLVALRIHLVQICLDPRVIDA